MTQQSGNITKLEWVTCPNCSQTFQIAVPTKATDMRIRIKAQYVDIRQYHLRLYCINPSCRSLFFIETDLPKGFRPY